MHSPKILTTTHLLTILTLLTLTAAGPASYGIYQAGYSAVVVARYSTSGAVFGTITAGVGTPATVLGCNVAFGKCSAACAGILLVPTP